ncbi:hypothetical protein [Collimonas antrihumi]|uniref:hypothetical protein n=1 Tax=Collimonas antrihumi TaxID=1940615 RepID=UPI001B8D8F48|nr:hypothetical protein [Collimonas antrihumi]
MQRAMLLVSLALVVSCSAAVAATPVFQLNTSEAGASHLQAIDTYPSKVERTDPNKAMPTTLTPHPARAAPAVPVIFSETRESSNVWRAANTVPVAFSRNADDGAAPGKVSSDLNNSDDLLFYFLKNFEAQPREKPGSWALLLVGLCFVLYQVRRRPMRTSLGFFAGSKHIGQLGT